MPIFRGTNCIITASGIVILCTVQYSMPDEQTALQSALRAVCSHPAFCTAENDDTRCCDNAICPPEDGYVDVRNMSRIIM